MADREVAVEVSLHDPKKKKNDLMGVYIKYAEENSCGKKKKPIFPKETYHNKLLFTYIHYQIQHLDQRKSELLLKSSPDNLRIS